MSETYDRTKQLLDQLVYSSGSAPSTDAAGQTAILPLEQRALFERLQSFTPLTWFGKPPELSAATCAAKGWRNTGPDVLTCDSCGAKIWCKLPADLLSESAVGICRGFSQQLIDAHDAACTQRSTPTSSSKEAQKHFGPQVKFPILPSSRLISSYHSRVQDLQRVECIPPLAAAVVPRLVKAAQQLHPSLCRALAALLQLPVQTLEQQLSAAVDDSAALLQLSRQQIVAVLALCGWQVQPLLPPHLARKTAARPSSAFAVSHLVPRGNGASSSAAAAIAAEARDGHSSSNGSNIAAEHAVLHCELCGCKAGLWRQSQSGPYYISQLASKAMSMLVAAEAAYHSSQHAAADRATLDSQHKGGVLQPASPAADRRHISSLNTIAGGALHAPLTGEQEQQQQQDGDSVGVTSPDAVVTSLYNTIAGGSLLGAPAPAASGGGVGGLGASPRSKTSSPAAVAAGSIRTSPGFRSQGTFGALTSPSRPGPFGAPAAPAFGSAAGVEGNSSSLFGLPSAAAANVFGTTTAPAAANSSPAPAPVFGLGALKEEEQRTKRRRSSSEAVAGSAAAGATSLGRSMSASPGFKVPPGLSSGQRTVGQQPSAKQQRLDETAAASGGGSGGTRSFMKQPRLGLVAAAQEAAGAAAASIATFDPLSQHRSWCPWVNAVSGTTGRAAGAVPGVADADSIAAALAVGWSSTLLALQEQQEEQQLLAGGEQQKDGEMVGLLGSVPKPGQFESTAAVLAKARMMLDALEG